MDLLLIFGIPLAVGFAAGYTFRAYLSRQHRQRARRLSPWQTPTPDERR